MANTIAANKFNSVSHVKRMSTSDELIFYNNLII